MTHGKRWLLWTPFVAAGIVLAAWYQIWRAGAEAMRGALAGFASEQERSGGAFSHAPMRAKGFPFFLRGEIGAATFVRGAWRWDADAVYLHAMPWAPGRIVFATGPSMRLREPGGAWTIRADAARASIEAAQSGWLFKAEAAALEGVSDKTAVSTERSVINVSPDARKTGAYSLHFRLLGATLKNSRGEVLISRLDGALSIAPGLRRITVHGFDGEIGAGRAQLSGALEADGEGYLKGALSVRLTNPAGLAESLRVLGAVNPREARAVEAGLAFIGAAAGGQVEAPLVFSDGEMTLAGVKIGKSPRIAQP